MGVGTVPDCRGIGSLTEQIAAESVTKRIAVESTPIFDELVSTDVGGRLADLCEPDVWDSLAAPWTPWDLPADYELPALPMSSMVSLVADRLQALTAPTELFPIIEGELV